MVDEQPCAKRSKYDNDGFDDDLFFTQADLEAIDRMAPINFAAYVSSQPIDDVQPAPSTSTNRNESNDSIETMKHELLIANGERCILRNRLEQCERTLAQREIDIHELRRSNTELQTNSAAEISRIEKIYTDRLLLTEHELRTQTELIERRQRQQTNNSTANQSQTHDQMSTTTTPSALPMRRRVLQPQSTNARSSFIGGFGRGPKKTTTSNDESINIDEPSTHHQQMTFIPIASQLLSAMRPERVDVGIQINNDNDDNDDDYEQTNNNSLRKYLHEIDLELMMRVAIDDDQFDIDEQPERINQIVRQKFDDSTIIHVWRK